MKPSLILICISTNWCHNFYDVKYTTRMQFTYVPSTSINKNFSFSKEKDIFGSKRPTHGNFCYKTHSLFKDYKRILCPVGREGVYRGLLRKGYFRYYFHNVYDNKIEVV